MGSVWPRFAVAGAVMLATASVARAAPHERADANGSCAACHTEIGREWSTSLHRNAWTDSVFQEAYQVEPLAFCRGCHAPDSDAALDPPSPRAAHFGVGCTSCHVGSDGALHSAKAPSSAATAQHAITVDAKLATVQACASCHQFDFPAHSGQKTPEPMQDTVEEHRASSKSSETCQSCHMPIVDGPDGQHRSHDFRVLANPAMLRRAVTITAMLASGSPTTARISLTAAEIGHAFPTGDMFRRIEVRGELLSARGVVLATAEPIVLARSFVDHARESTSLVDVEQMRVTANDTRVPAPGGGPRVAMLTFSPTAGATSLRWSVVYQRMSSPMASAFGVNQALDEIPLAHGDLTLPTANAITTTNTSHHFGGTR